MIFVNAEGLESEYKLRDILKLFFDDKEIFFSREEPPTGYGGIFLLCRIEHEGENSTLYIQLGNSEHQYTSNTPVTSSIAGMSSPDTRKMHKWQIKREIYLALSKYTKRDLPWGMLTGIRPAKIVHEMVKKGLEKEETIETLRKFYMISDEKSNLVYEVAKNEISILDKATPDMAGIYIGIPFCPSRCLYCSFTSNPIDKYRHLLDKYIEALKTEIMSVQSIIERNALRIQSIYLGGGTPTSLDSQILKELLQFIENKFDLNELEEFTLEAGRPDSIDGEKLEIIKGSRVSRISINPQTMNDSTLELIGRKHTSEDIVEAFRLARKIGFNNINMDLIVGLPGENLKMFEHTLEEIAKMQPESLTVHTMAVKRASRLHEYMDSYCLIQADEASGMIDMAQRYAESMEMHPYYLYRQKNILGNLENIGYSKRGYESIYNIQIMEERQTIIALGAGSVTKVVYPSENRIERAFNVKNVEEYINRIDEMVDRKRALLPR